MESIDYYKLYCDFTNPDFLATLKLSHPESEVIRLMTEQSAEFNRLYTPKLQIEGLVHASNSPYQALRTLHNLRENRIIFYNLLEVAPEPNTSAAVIDAVQEQTQKYVENKSSNPGDILPNTENDTMSFKVERLKVYERYALLNIEYPVVYFCLKEEMEIQPNIDVPSLDIFYSMIRRNKLALALSQSQFPTMLEFLQYVQSVFGQPLSEVQGASPEKSAEEQLAEKHDNVERGEEELPNEEGVP